MTTRIDLADRTAIVTGAARGIGLAIVDRLLDSGARVALWDRDEAALDVAEEQFAGRGRVLNVTVDITDEAAVTQAMRTTEAKLGPVSILVNNAGIG